MSLQPHQERVFIEKQELDDKLKKLREFIYSSVFDSLTGNEQLLLDEQRNCMEKYSNILQRRIEDFK